MSVINEGNQTIVFDFKYPAKAGDFNKLLRNVITPGIYKGGNLSYVSNDVDISPFTTAFNTGPDDQLVVINTEAVVTKTILEATPVIYMKYVWSDVVENWIDFEQRAEGAPVANEVVLGKALFSGGAIIGFDYSDRTFPAVHSDNILHTNKLYIGANDIEDSAVSNGIYVNNPSSNCGLVVCSDCDSVYGEAITARGIVGCASNTGILACSTGNYGLVVHADGDTGIESCVPTGQTAIVGCASSNGGVYGYSGASYGVYGQATAIYGVYGCSLTCYGIVGIADSCLGVVGCACGGNYGGAFIATNCIGVYGYATNYFGGCFSTSGYYGVYGYASLCYGVVGCATHFGVAGYVNVNYGVYGNAGGSYGVAGYAAGNYGGYFTSGSVIALYACSASNCGVVGCSGSGYCFGVQGCATYFGVFGCASYYGLYGTVNSSCGVVGCAGVSCGVVGSSPGTRGVVGAACNYGVYGCATNAYGVIGYAGGAPAVAGNGPYADISSKFLKYKKNICFTECVKNTCLTVYEYFWEDSNQTNFHRFFSPTLEDYEDTFDVGACDYKYTVDGIALGLGIENLNRIDTLELEISKLKQKISELTNK